MMKRLNSVFYLASSTARGVGFDFVTGLIC